MATRDRKANPYTPGPWTAEPHGNRNADGSSNFAVFAPDPYEYAKPGDLTMIAEYLTHGNAQLISAAPDLLTACERAESFLGELRRHLPDLRAIHCANVLETLRNAMAKATAR